MHVIALFQVLIYVGAVMVFMVYTIMLLDDRDIAYRKRFSATLVPGVIDRNRRRTRTAAPARARHAGCCRRTDQAAPFGFTAFSTAFMQQYWFHFELATVLLLVGIVAAWTVIREER